MMIWGARGFNEWTLADVTGHSTEGKALGMTMAVYPGPADVATKRACVEAVRAYMVERTFAVRKMGTNS